MSKVTFLGPVGATFSHDAYQRLLEIYQLPSSLEYADVSNNSEVLPTVCEHGGYGVVAMDTLAEGRVTEPLESFIELLRIYPQNICPIHVIGAVQMRLHFYLMARKGVSRESIDQVIAHPKSFGACKEWVKSKGWPMMSVSSNGEAARLIAGQNEYAKSAVLGPKSAAQKYDLEILEENCEDCEAITTFFLIGPRHHPISIDRINRMLIVFSVPHCSGALVKALRPFEEERLNLMQIHSAHVCNHTYHFAIELEVSESEIAQMQRAMHAFGAIAASYISFGPFAVLS